MDRLRTPAPSIPSVPSGGRGSADPAAAAPSVPRGRPGRPGRPGQPVRRTRTRTSGLLLLLAPALLLAACSGGRPPNLGVVGTALAPCPNTPNCVNTGDRTPAEVAPLRLAPIWVGASDADLWPLVVEAVQELPRTRIITQEPGYLHAESRSRLFRFVDDLEVYRDRVLGELVVRSASRFGYSDLGVNAERVEALRDGLMDRGVVVPAPGLAGRF